MSTHEAVLSDIGRRLDAVERQLVAIADQLRLRLDQDAGPGEQ